MGSMIKAPCYQRVGGRGTRAKNRLIGAPSITVAGLKKSKLKARPKMIRCFRSNRCSSNGNRRRRFFSTLEFFLRLNSLVATKGIENR